MVAAVYAAGHVRAHARHLRLVREGIEISGGEIEISHQQCDVNYFEIRGDR